MECTDPLVYATHDYELPEKGFLPLHANDVLYVVEADASGWWLGKNRAGAKGVFPSTYTQPFLFRYPPAPIQEMLSQLRRANDFHLDLVSGVPRPLTRPTSVLARDPPTVASLDEMYALTNEGVLRNEALRAAALERLTYLSTLEHAVYAATTLATPTPTPEPTPTRAEAEDSEPSLDAVMNRIAALRQEVLANPDAPLPSADWYRRYHRVLKRGPGLEAVAVVGEAGSSIAYSPAELQLQDLQRRVAQRERVLEALAPEVKQLEHEYLHEREALRRRIAVRDDLVSLCLASWAQRAEQCRSAYLQTKANNQCTEANDQMEEERLRDSVQQGKETFLRLSHELKALNGRAKSLRSRLGQKDALKQLEERIDAANECIASLRRRQRTSIVQTQ